MLTIDVTKMWEAPITTRDKACSFIAWNMFVLGDGRMWHIEDDARDVKKGATNELFWTPEEAAVLNNRSDECFEVLGEDVYDIVHWLMQLNNTVEHTVAGASCDGPFDMVLILVDSDRIEIERGLVKNFIGVGTDANDHLVLAGESYDMSDLLAKIAEMQDKG